ncbi:unnamed protein product [Calypogeia fissa]
MAFTSKVVFVLLVSSLAWCQVFSQESKPVRTIVKGLADLTALTNNLTTQVKGIAAMGNFISEGPKVLQGIQNITNMFSEQDDYLKTLPVAPLSDPNRKLLEAYEKLLVAVQDLMNVLADQYTPTGLEDSAKKLRTAVEDLIVQATGYYTFDLVELYPSSQTQDGRLLERDLAFAIAVVIFLYND